MNKKEMAVVALLGGTALMIPLAGLAAFAFVLSKVAATEYLVPVTAITVAGWIATEIIAYLKWKAKRSGKEAIRKSLAKELRDGMSTLDQRLTEVQDVMIVLSEKFDRLEVRERS